MALAHPQVVSIHQDLARSLISLGLLQAELGQRSPAMQSFDRAIAILEPLVHDHPDDPDKLKSAPMPQEIIDKFARG